MVDCRLGDSGVGTRDDERENTSRIVGGNKAGDDEAVTPCDLCSFRTPDQASIRRCQGDGGLLQAHWL